MRRVLIALGLVALWSIPGLLSAATTVLLFPQSQTIGGNPVRFIVITVVPWWTWAMLTPAIAAFSRRVPLDSNRVARAILMHASAAVVCGFVYVLAVTLFMKAAIAVWPVQPTEVAGIVVRERPPEPFLAFLRGFVSSRFPIGIVLYATVAGLTTAFDELRRRRSRELLSARLESDLARAELQALQMQLQPHFLFNTLHAISLLVTENPTAATRMIAQLGDLLRETLRLADTPEVPLRQELDLLRQYLAIEETRFGPRLTTEISTSPELLDVRVPCFILQPLVENAVRHGIAPRLEPGRVAISATRSGERLRLTVEDDGRGFGSTTRDSGIGLRSTRDRLAVRYREDARLICGTSPTGGASVTIEMPLQHA